MNPPGQKSKNAKPIEQAQASAATPPARIGYLDEMIQFAAARRKNETGDLNFDQWLEQRFRKSLRPEQQPTRKRCAKQ